MATKKSNLPNLKEAYKKQDEMDAKTEKGKNPGPQPFPPAKKKGK